MILQWIIGTAFVATFVGLPVAGIYYAWRHARDRQ